MSGRAVHTTCQDRTYGGVYCAGNDATFEFLENVLAEVIDLFPSKYIHIGGDEVPKDDWKQCKKCQARIRQEGLKNENELQSYFVRRIEKFLNARGRVLIGWDEILEGGLAPNAAVMSWRGIEGRHCRGQRRPRRRHDAHLPLLLRLPPGEDRRAQGHRAGVILPLETVYCFEPVPPSLAADKVKHILGAGGNLWSEYFPNYAHVQYMAYPRACAMAEVTWTDPKHKNWDDFKNRLDCISSG